MTAAATAPFTVTVATYGADALTETADVYARMTDELAAFCADSTAAWTVAGRALIADLGALHVALDELTARAPIDGELEQLAAKTGDLAALSIEQDDPWFSVAHRGLSELHDALTELIEQGEG